MHTLLAYCGIVRPRASCSQQQRKHGRFFAITLLFTASFVALFVLTPTVSAQDETVRLRDGNWPSDNFRISAGNVRHFWYSPSLQRRDRTGGLDRVFAPPQLERLARRQAESLGDIYVTVTMCEAPKSEDGRPVPQLEVFYSENIDTPSPNDGSQSFSMRNGLAENRIPDVEQLYIGVYAPEGSSDRFTFQIAASSRGFVYNYTNEVGLRLDDTDNEHALVTTLVNFTGSPSVTTFQRNYQMYIAQTDVLAGLERSMCAVTSRVTNEHAKEKAVLSSTTRGEGKGWRVSAFFDELKRNTNYSVFLRHQDDDGVMRVWQPTFVKTKHNNNCRVIHGLETCDKVAYAVPADVSLSTVNVRNFYDNTARDRYDNFTKTLEQFPCDRSQYSLVRDCTHCRAAYKDWLCAVTIPRCASATRATGETLENGLLRNGSSRNPEIDRRMEPGPYLEVPPCIDLCYIVVQSCPPFLGFGCPLLRNTLLESYALMTPDGSARNETGVTCNAMDLDFVALSSGERAFGRLGPLIWAWSLIVMCIVSTPIGL